jgi:signal transduction histidine kinase
VEQFQRILREEWGNLNELINHIVTLQQLRSQGLTVYPQTLYLESLIQELTTSFREQWTENPQKNLRIEGEIGNPLPTIRTDSQHLRAILQELLTNAGNFSHSRTTVYLKVFSQNQQEAKEPTLSIGVINTGKGIPEAEIPLIFQAFKRGEGATGSIPGIGIGLALVDGLVKLLGGTIEVISTPDPTSSSHITQFTLTLPQNPPPPKENL